MGRERVAKAEKKGRYPRGVKRWGSGKKKHAAYCAHKFISGHETIEEASVAYQAFVKGKEDREWEEHRSKEINPRCERGGVHRVEWESRERAMCVGG